MYLDTIFTHVLGGKEAAAGQTLVCMVEPGNSHDRNAMAVEKDGNVAGHWPQKGSHCEVYSEERWGKRSLHSD